VTFMGAANVLFPCQNWVCMYVFRHECWSGVLVGTARCCDVCVYTKYSSYRCVWYRRASDQRYVKRELPARIQCTPSAHCVIQEALVATDKNWVPPLHVTLRTVGSLRSSGPHNKCTCSVSTFRVQSDVCVFTGPHVTDPTV
jgi:hypothetical protein